MIWFTADTHFGHRAVIDYCKRPFTDVAEMDAEMIRRWNERVQPGALVYHLGDFAFANHERMREIREQLNGTVVLVCGNHDSRRAARLAGFDIIIEGAISIARAYGRLYLRHVPHPLEIEDRGSRGVSAPSGCDLHLCGHVHERWKRIGNVVNVGVDQWGFAPVSEVQLMAEVGIEP